MALSSSNTNSTQIGYSGDLMIDVGNRVGMYYSSSGSYAVPSTDVFQSYYGLSCSVGGYDFNTVKNNLSAGKPVLITAFPEYGAGHCWIIDGYHENRIHYVQVGYLHYTEDWEDADYVYTDAEVDELFGDPEDGQMVEIHTYNVTGRYLLMNQGYDGLYDNGYYAIAESANWNGYSYSKTIYYNFNEYEYE